MQLTASNIANDLDIVDSLGSVNVQQINAVTGAVLATAVGVKVLRRVVEKSEVPAGEGEVQVETCRWHLKASDVGFVPKERDRIVDGAEAWKIEKVTKAAFATRYVCETTKVRG